jgi:peptidoglycan/LPS O-acetylase OafA/YrhL
MIEQATPTRERIEWLDSIRGLAALAVLFFHLGELSAPPAGYAAVVTQPLISVLQDGRTAVTMFFVLSGFVLALPYARRRTDGAYRVMAVGSFYLRRVARIWCPWFVAFCLSMVAKVTIFREYPSPISQEPRWLPHLFWQMPLRWSEILRQLVFALPEQRLRLIGQDWSLQIEMVGSILMPVMLWLLRKNPLWLMAATIAAVVAYHESYLYVPFVAGVLLARYAAEAAAFFRRLSPSVKWAFFILGLLIYNVRFLWGFSLLYDRPKWCVATVGCTLLLIACLGSDRLKALLCRRVFVFFGRISFSLYLLQHLVIFCAIPAWAWFCYRIGLANRNFVFFSSFAIGTILSILIAIPSYRWVEVPCIKLGKMISKRLENRKEPRAAVSPAAAAGVSQSSVR